MIVAMMMNRMMIIEDECYLATSLGDINDIDDGDITMTMTTWRPHWGYQPLLVQSGSSPTCTSPAGVFNSLVSILLI